MAKIAFMTLILCLGAADVSQVEQAETIDISYRIVSAKSESESFIDYKFARTGCEFWEYFRGNAYKGYLLNREDFYRINAVAFAFEYPKPFESTKKHQQVESFSRYLGKTYIGIDDEKILVHKFSVSDAAGNSRIYVSDDYPMPIGYDSAKLRIRATSQSLKNMKMISCDNGHAGE